MQNIITDQEVYQKFLMCVDVVTDTRQIKEGCIFFALKGDRFDGNTFAIESLIKGAKFAVVDNADVAANNDRLLLVDDVLKSLQEIAILHRMQLSCPVVGLTGSNGKTTTKELALAVMSKKFKTQATVGNLNNHIGVPLTILRTPIDCQFLIVEMGANHQGEIKELCKIALPNYVMITNIGKAHLEGFGGVEGIKKGKSEIYRHVDMHQGQIFINQDDEVLTSLLPERAQVIKYFVSELKIKSGSQFLEFDFKDILVTTNLYGNYNLPNVAFALSLGNYFGVKLDDAIEAVSSYMPTNNRSQILEKKGVTYIMDAYNANPSSMELSLENFDQQILEDKITVLGDMLELGEYSKLEHQKIIERVDKMKLMHSIFIGPEFFRLSGGKVGYFLNTQDAKPYFDSLDLKNGSIVLLKGSRGIGVEKLISD